MRRRGRAIAAALTSALLLAVMIHAATATTLTVVDRAIRTTFSPMSFESSGATVRCPVTLEGSFTQGTFTKVARSRIGAITRTGVGACTGGTVRLLNETLPWTTQYASFAGTLPNITSVNTRLINAAMQITPTGGPTCTARSSEESPIVLIAQREGTSGQVSSLRAEESSTIPLSGEGICSLFRGRLIGSGTPTVLGGTTAILVLLGEDGALKGSRAEESEAVHPIKDLEIPRERTLGVRSITNSNQIYEIRITAILKIEGNPEQFTILTGEPEDCTTSTTLRPRSANACNIRTGFTGSTRPAHTKIVITYEWGLVAPYPREQSYTVTAN